MNEGDFVIHWTLDSGDGALLKASVSDNAVTAYGRLAQVTYAHVGASPALSQF